MDVEMSVDSMGLHSHGDSILQNKYVHRVGLVALIPYPCSAIVLVLDLPGRGNAKGNAQVEAANH